MSEILQDAPQKKRQSRKGNKMKFFVPLTRNRIESDKFYQSIRLSAERQTKWAISKKKIFSILYSQNGEKYQSTVGQRDSMNGELVYSILEAENCFLVCTTSKGAFGGFPILVSKKLEAQVEEFDEDETMRSKVVQ